MDGFEDIYRRYFTDIYRYLLKLTHDASAAEEITAETFFRAMNAMDRFRNESSVRSWLCAIARNIFLDRARKNSRESDLSDTLMMRIPDPKPDPEQTAMRRIEAENIRKILAGLKEPYRTVFTRRYAEDLSYAAIAEEFGKTENWACVTCHRAKDMIRKELKSYEE